MMIEDLETIDNWLKEEYGISYTELCQEFNGAVELNIKYLNKIAQENEEYRKELEYFKNKSSRQMVEIERLNNIIEKIDEFISYKIIIEANAKGYQITLKDLTDIKKKLLELKGVDKE